MERFRHVKKDNTKEEPHLVLFFIIGIIFTFLFIFLFSILFKLFLKTFIYYFQSDLYSIKYFNFNFLTVIIIYIFIEQ